MRLAPIVIALILPLAACDSGPSVTATNATQAEVQEKLAASGAGDTVMVQPGRWEGAMAIHEIDVPNMPPEAKEQMRAQLSRTNNFVSCVTEEDVKQQKALFTGDMDDKSCKYDSFSLSGGKIDARMTCDRGDEGKMTMSMKGDYSADTYRMDMTSRAEGNSPMGAMSMKMSVNAKRVGVCRGTEDES
ncbi:hypothetical protein SLG_04890 [Sphingobium sp. SYK-6]|uniref:DUF3617 domain-containing protein n=1 Tax=Sphingobium sp. (strain NBRC 103272 / SYK-6) TaxID=627192 RepID=UPI0002276751|nr:DUF3617 domain-containing protein [Sphingobium sp. SYK-6]BAK65164.1 hypothetical protein SLG_04890 [Sphingobium sp. SYK-6]